METLKENLDGIKKLLNEHSYDWLNVVTGGEGTGKSTLSLRICRYVDPDFSVDQVVYTAEDFMDTARQLPPGSAIDVDEGALVFFSRDAMKTETKEAIQFLTGVRERNLFININVPDFFLLDKYIREHRVKSLCRVVNRGWFHFYSKKRVQDLHRDGNRTIWPNPNFRDSWTKMEGEFWQQYRERKQEQLFENDDVDDDINYLRPEEFGERVGVSRQTVNNWYNDGRIDAKKLFNGELRIPEEQLEVVFDEE